MNRINRAACLLISSLFFFQCQKDLSYVGGPDTGIPGTTAADPIKANLQGTILDEQNQPAAGVSVTVGNTITMTNATGTFRLVGAGLDKNTSLVTAEKPGYFKAYRVFSATQGANQVVLKLIKKTVAATVTGTVGGTATLVNGAKISLPANGIVLAASGASYTGEVKVYAAYIDPTAADISEVVPGSFMADDKNGKRVSLSSFGMLAVELETAAGEKLQVKTGATATLTTPIPPAALANAPATIPLWHVDEQTGIWKEEGSATKQGNSYVGDVKHFTYWNCDLPLTAFTITFTLVNSNGAPMVNVPVKITTAGYYGSAHGYTDSLGQVKGLVPANRDLVLEVTDPCGGIAFSQNLSPITKNTDLGTIAIAVTVPSVVSFKGKLLDCSGLPVTNGYAIISFNHIARYAATNSSGEFSTSFITCTTPGSATVIGLNNIGQQQSAGTTVAITTPLSNAGNITACGTSSAQFVNYTLDGTNYSITSTANDSIGGFSLMQANISTTHIQGQKFPPGIENLTFNVKNANAAGTFPINEMKLHNFRTLRLNTPFNVIFTTYANTAGEFYEGTLSGTFTVDSTTTVHNLTSVFKVRRNN